MPPTTRAMASNGVAAPSNYALRRKATASKRTTQNAGTLNSGIKRKGKLKIEKSVLGEKLEKQKLRMVTT